MGQPPATDAETLSALRFDPKAEPPADARPEPEVLGRLRAEPHAFEFFQAVNLLERLTSQRAPVAGFGDPRDEIVRFRTPTSVAFPASEI
jgi:type VI secretion system protein ImpH